MRTTDYALRYAKAQEFFGFDTPADVLVAMAAFDNVHDNQTVTVSLHWSEDGQYGGTLTWEDLNE